MITRRPGFLRDAAVRVHDAYIAGQGLLHASVLGLITMADLHGDGEIARGELFGWEAVDDRSANATLVDGPLTPKLLFCFNDAGLIDSVRAEARSAVVGKTLVMIPWEGRWSDYRTRNGMMVPNTGEIAWMRPEGRRSYFRGTVTSPRHEFVFEP